jgi:hypothetical protein
VEDDPLTPDERRLFEELAADIDEELSAQIAVGRLNHPDDLREGVRVTARLIADVVWSGFEVRARAS